MYCCVWEYAVKRGCVADFRRAYGPGGDWARLFRREAAYLRTELLADRENPARFVTLDFWESKDAWLAFRERWRADYDALDARFGVWTLEERRLGEFDNAAGPDAGVGPEAEP